MKVKQGALDWMVADRLWECPEGLTLHPWKLFQRILPIVLINIFACPQIRIWFVLRFNKAHHQVAEMWPPPGSKGGKPKLKHPRLLLNSLSTHARL